jgi:hypothetical protein
VTVTSQSAGQEPKNSWSRSTCLGPVYYHQRASPAQPDGDASQLPEQ